MAFFLVKRKSEVEMAMALQSNGRTDFLFALQQELDTYDHLQKIIGECDVMLEKKLNEIIGQDENKQQHQIAPKLYKKINKNTPKGIDLNLKSYQMFEGIDLLAFS